VVRSQRHAPAALYPRERLGTHCTGGWVGPRAGLDRCGKSSPTGIRSPDRPTSSLSIYRLSYPGLIQNGEKNSDVLIPGKLCVFFLAKSNFRLRCCWQRQWCKSWKPSRWIHTLFSKQPECCINILIIQMHFVRPPHVVPTGQATVITRNIFITRITHKVRSLGKADTRWGNTADTHRPNETAHNLPTPAHCYWVSSLRLEILTALMWF